MSTLPSRHNEQDHAPLQRIVIVGTSGSGKTTLARALAERLGIPAIQLDELYWDPGWSAVPTQVLRERVATVLEQHPSWIIDGNYNKIRDLTWARADTLIWLDYSLPLVMYRVIRRTMSRSLTGQELYNGNRERLSRAFFSRKSIILWALTSHWRNARNYGSLGQQTDYAHLTIIRHRSPAITQAWMAAIPALVESSKKGSQI